MCFFENIKEVKMDIKSILLPNTPLGVATYRIKKMNFTYENNLNATDAHVRDSKANDAHVRCPLLCLSKIIHMNK